MKNNSSSKIKCEMPFYPFSHHLDQLYTGFESLRKQNIIDLHYSKNNYFQPYNKLNIIKVRINNTIDAVYDLSDGINWLLGESLENNMKYFNENLKADFYFKRSLNQEFNDRISDFVNVLPYGFNYPITTKLIFKHQILNSIKKSIDYPLIHKFIDFNLHSIKNEEFEYLPLTNNQNKIIFLVRLWDPNSLVETIESKEIREEREHLNLTRVNSIRACKQEFGEMFIGGVQDFEFSRKYCKDLIQPRYITNRANYLHKVKEANICITTTGLHGSIGWKFGEYIAAARAIITEPLNYHVPGDFEKNKNYFEFHNPTDLLDKIHILIHDKTKMNNMMFENYKYYKAYLSPDILILNTLNSMLNN